MFHWKLVAKVELYNIIDEIPLPDLQVKYKRNYTGKLYLENGNTQKHLFLIAAADCL